MQVLQTTRRQRLIASDILPTAWWFLIVPGAALAVSLSAVGSLRFAFSDLWSAGLFLMVTLLSLLIGFWIGTVTAWFMFGPFLYHQGLVNGGPFQEGDLVQVIAGRYRDRVGRIYGRAQHDTWRVDLGEEARTSYTDIFPDYKLLRVENASEAAVGNEHQT